MILCHCMPMQRALWTCESRCCLWAPRWGAIARGIPMVRMQDEYVWSIVECFRRWGRLGCAMAGAGWALSLFVELHAPAYVSGCGGMMHCAPYAKKLVDALPSPKMKSYLLPKILPIILILACCSGMMELLRPRMESLLSFNESLDFFRAVNFFSLESMLF
jgi:hypothetical protein